MSAPLARLEALAEYLSKLPDPKPQTEQGILLMVHNDLLDLRSYLFSPEFEERSREG